MAKGFGILLMILGHSEVPSVITALHKLIYMFHMPLFFIVSGFLYMPGNSFDIKKKFRKIMVPYIIVFVLSIIPYYIIYKDFDVLWIFPLMKTRTLFGMDNSFGIGPVWFLPCYFISSYLVYELCRRFTHIAVLSASFVLFTLLFILSRLVHGLPFLLYQTSLGIMFIVLGIYCNRKNYLNNKWIVAVGCMAVVLSFFWGSFSMYSVGCRLWFIQIVAALFCSLLVIEISRRISSNSLLQYISKHSLSILCIHSLDWSFGITKSMMAFWGVSDYYHFLFYCLFVAVGMLLVRLSDFKNKLPIAD